MSSTSSEEPTVEVDKSFSAGDFSTLHVPDVLQHFTPPPGEYAVMVSCICNNLVDWVITDPEEFRGMHIAMHLPGMSGPPPENCKRRSWHRCGGEQAAGSYGHKLRKGIPLHLVLKPKYPPGTTTLDWGAGPKREGE